MPKDECHSNTVIECLIAARVREANRSAEREREREPDEPVDGNLRAQLARQKRLRIRLAAIAGTSGNVLLKISIKLHIIY